jgi:hypothetical protein
MTSIRFICGYCYSPTASDRGYYAVKYGQPGTPPRAGEIRICSFCDSPTYFSKDNEQFPGPPPFGEPVNDLPEDVNALYEEARDCIAVNAHTAAVMCCRKLLMHIAVSRKAEKNKPFAYYVDYLADQGFVPPDGKEWVDVIRKKGNEANHEIVVMEREDAEDLITFSAMLLRVIYEFPAMLKARAARTQGNQLPANPPSTPQGHHGSPF